MQASVLTEYKKTAAPADGNQLCGSLYYVSAH